MLEALLTQEVVKGRTVRLMFQDEARFGRMVRIRRCWAPIPERPMVDNGCALYQWYISPQDLTLAHLIGSSSSRSMHSLQLSSSCSSCSRLRGFFSNPITGIDELIEAELVFMVINVRHGGQIFTWQTTRSSFGRHQKPLLLIPRPSILHVLNPCLVIALHHRIQFDL